MRKVIADQLRRGLEEALVLAQEQDAFAVHIPEQVDVRAIRVRLNMTQQQFAICFGFSVNTLRHWEQGRRIPEGPTRAYLLVIDREPEAVQKALRIA
ncbi:helix-turn-helix domain-containing protein [Acidicapsa ligni]|uniref:helix-turn-helix domain-containing protein n=1 Tax=Acidicapsa ligni TaxID=542300 RepID=UPI0021DF5505|nr:hypothetical protein [Acidicapsa ligni]